MTLVRAAQSAAAYVQRLFGTEPPYSTVGTWIRNQNSSAPLNERVYNTSNAHNDAFVWRPRAFAAGTYTVTVAGLTGPTAAIATLQYSTDGVAWTTIGTVDLYNTSSLAFWGDIPNVVIPDGTYYIRAVALTRNASNTTGWFVSIANVQFTRTGP